ncbi:MAG: SlyX family protein, partial [Myxococcaceae bacterium]|nr:SlyX family protein [Myxococcaceae bacterium]
MSETSDERIINLEIKQAFVERGLEELDAVVRGLNLEVERLRKEVSRLQRQLSEE